MITLDSLEALDAELQSDGLVLAYFTRPGCGVCTALKPKLHELLSHHPGIRAFEIDVDAHPQAAAQHSIFTLPGLLLFVDGREHVREARYMSIEALEARIDRIESLYQQ